MTNSFKVSVIIPTFNLEKFVERAVNSVRNQSYKNVEIIIVDGGSTDGTAILVENIVKVDPKVFLIQAQKNGVSYLRNRALEVISGEYVMFLDGDDFLHPGIIETLVSKVNDGGYDWISFDYQLEDVKGVRRKVHVTEELTEMYSAVWNKIYKASLFQDVRFPEGKTFGDDVVVSLVLHSKAQNKYALSQIGYSYWQRVGSVMNSKLSYLTHFQVAEVIKEYVEQSEVRLTLEQQMYFNRQLFMHFVFSICKAGAEKLKYPKRISFLYYQIHVMVGASIFSNRLVNMLAINVFKSMCSLPNNVFVRMLASGINTYRLKVRR